MQTSFFHQKNLSRRTLEHNIKESKSENSLKPLNLCDEVDSFENSSIIMATAQQQKVKPGSYKTPVPKIEILDGSFHSQLKRKMGSLDNYFNLVVKNFYAHHVITRDIHLEYLRCGANLIRTNTYDAAFPRLEKAQDMKLSYYKYMISEHVRAVKEAIEIHIKRAKANKHLNYYAVGSCGSATRCNDLSIRNTSREDYKNYHRERVSAFNDNQIDRLSFESIETEEEAFAIIELLEEFPHIRAFMLFYSDNTGHLLDGKDVSIVAQKCYSLSPYNVLAVGINCVPTQYVRSIILQMRCLYSSKFIKVPLVACPRNDSISRDASPWCPMISHTNYPAKEWGRMNINFIGGCCNTLPEHIAQLRKEIYKCKQAVELWQM